MNTRTINTIVHARNEKAYAVGKMHYGHFNIRRIVWGMVMASEECRDDEEIRSAIVLITSTKRRRRR